MTETNQGNNSEWLWMSINENEFWGAIVPASNPKLGLYTYILTWGDNWQDGTISVELYSLRNWENAFIPRFLSVKLRCFHSQVQFSSNCTTLFSFQFLMFKTIITPVSFQFLMFKFSFQFLMFKALVHFKKGLGCVIFIS